MAGHSKWANIKHRKAKQDAKKGSLYTKLSRAITVAAKEGGPDINFNTRLYDAVQKAKDANMPSDNIERAIKKGTGELESAAYEEVVYEGYGPGGVAVILDIMTDNRNRTASEVRHIFDKNGGSLGETGCVGWMFDKKGIILIEKNIPVDEDTLLMIALDSGAEDFSTEDQFYQITTNPGDLRDINSKLKDEGFTIYSAEVTMVPKTTVVINDKEMAAKVIKLIEMLEENDDVQQVYTNVDIPDELISE